MTIEEVQQRKEDLKNDIYTLIEAFENETGLTPKVESVYSSGDRARHYITVEVKI